jgi:hypothetical protein
MKVEVEKKKTIAVGPHRKETTTVCETGDPL